MFSRLFGKNNKVMSGTATLPSPNYVMTIKCDFKPNIFVGLFGGVTNKAYNCVCFSTRDGNGQIGQQQVGAYNGFGQYHLTFGDDYVTVTLPQVGNAYISATFNYWIA